MRKMIWLARSVAPYAVTFSFLDGWVLPLVLGFVLDFFMDTIPRELKSCDLSKVGE